MATAGMYEEATDLLRQTDRSSLPPIARLLPLLPLYETQLLYTGRYLQSATRHWRQPDDSLMQVLPSTSSLYLERKEMREAAAGNLDKALSINDARLASATPDTPEYALVTYHRSLLYHRLRNRGRRETLSRPVGTH